MNTKSTNSIIKEVCPHCLFKDNEDFKSLKLFFFFILHGKFVQVGPQHWAVQSFFFFFNPD